MFRHTSERNPTGVAPRLPMPLRILCVFAGLIVSLLIVAGMALGFYTFFDWRFAFVVLPVGGAAALLAAGAVSWWSKYR